MHKNLQMQARLEELKLQLGDRHLLKGGEYKPGANILTNWLKEQKLQKAQA